MDIFLDKRAVRQIRHSAADAIEDGDTETLREDIVEAFSTEQIDEIERRIDTDFDDFLFDTLEEWSGDEVGELFELLEASLTEIGIDVRYSNPELDEQEEDDEDEDDESDLEDTEDNEAVGMLDSDDE
ncbi:MAG: hypothetical protein MJD61_21770 [Proteobacteria bacterium]|nr:hypothetical protein [Pseudomonadota bacterium]